MSVTEVLNTLRTGVLVLAEHDAAGQGAEAAERCVAIRDAYVELGDLLGGVINRARVRDDDRLFEDAARAEADAEREERAVAARRESQRNDPQLAAANEAASQPMPAHLTEPDEDGSDSEPSTPPLNEPTAANTTTMGAGEPAATS